MKIKNQLIWKEVEDYVFITLGLMLLTVYGIE